MSAIYLDGLTAHLRGLCIRESHDSSNVDRHITWLPIASLEVNVCV